MVGSHHSENVNAFVSAGVLPGDPLPWILASAEPPAHWMALTGVLGVAEDAPGAIAARVALVADPAVRSLLEELPDWDGSGAIGDHHSPEFAPNLLGLLADLGVRAGEHPRLDALIEAMLNSRDKQGRFTIPDTLAGRPKPDRGAVTCDSNAIVDVMVRLGLAREPRVARALKRLVADATSFGQGRGWRCVPERRPLIDFAGRNADACPQVTLEAARALAHAPGSLRPPWAANAARTLLAFWNARADQRPYDFGHGYQFKTVKWPPVWYNALSVLDVVGSFPEVWEEPGATETDKDAIAQLAAALVAHNVNAAGRVEILRAHPGFGRFSFGRRGEESPFATARVLAALAPFAGLAERIAAVDVSRLPASRPLDRHAEGTRSAAACPVPQRRAYEFERVLPRVLTRQHLANRWEQASVESLVGDIVGLVVADPSTPYLSAAARLPGFEPGMLDRALDERRSLVRMRCMRGVVYAVRRDLVGVVHAASTRQVVRWARDFVSARGIKAAEYESLSARILEATAEEPLSTAQLRERLRPRIDLAAVVTLMAAETLLARCAPRGDRFSHATTYAPFESVYPDIVLGRISEDDARAVLLRAYVRGFGPVSARDAAWWTGMDLKRVRRAFDALEEELVEISLAGREGTWLMHAADAEELEWSTIADPPAVSLLPALDPLLLSYTDRSRFVSDTVRPFVFDTARNTAPVVLVNGRVAGVWDLAGRATEACALVHLFDEVPTPIGDRIAEEATRMATVRCAGEADIRFVPSMTPLADRAVGAFMHPLR